MKTVFADFNPILIYFTHHLVHSLSSASNIVKHYQHSSLHNHSFILIQTYIIKVKKKTQKSAKSYSCTFYNVHVYMRTLLTFLALNKDFCSLRF